MTTSSDSHFKKNYQNHLKHLKLKGLQPKTIKALVYLGRYLYKGVIQEKDIIACENGQVMFRYRDSKTQKLQRRTLPGAAFLWLMLRHVLPKGFRRTRNFGFLHPNSKRLIQLLQVLLGVRTRIEPSPGSERVRSSNALAVAVICVSSKRVSRGHCLSPR